ncbi:hypothetical protein [Streptomyces sp. NPDC089799]|uniref:hypothetical protein n=1 Tax=Streptomyces sp. NPDC089799 TaxID=3155066 RepID=UPI00344340A4
MSMTTLKHISKIAGISVAAALLSGAVGAVSAQAATQASASAVASPESGGKQCYARQDPVTGRFVSFPNDCTTSSILFVDAHGHILKNQNRPYTPNTPNTPNSPNTPATPATPATPGGGNTPNTPNTPN